MNDKIICIIPAREGSKGFPHKNRKLIRYSIHAARGIFNDSDIYVTTDDEVIKSNYYTKCTNIIDRPAELAKDETSMKDVLLHAVREIKPSDDTLLVVLYPTYPDRTSADIQNAIDFFNQESAESLLCRKKYTGVHPCLLMYPAFGSCGEQVIDHNLYRRQDYPEVFQISHFIIIMRVNELQFLNKNLYNNETVFYNVGDVIDVDTEDDYKKFNEHI
jgi:CMP-N,N'-diacetyllegionaminic acid synthase